MTARFFRERAWYCASASVALTLLLTGCPATPPVPGTPPVEDEFFTAGSTTAGRLTAGDRLDLPGGGSVGLPRGSPGSVEVTLVEGSLQADAVQSFRQWNPDVSLEGPVYKITVRPDAGAPPYLIVELPTSAAGPQIFVAGYIDADTSDLDWAPVFSTSDPQTGVVTAAVGLGLLEPAEADSGAGQKSAVTFQGGPLAYNGYVGVGIGGQQFDAQIVFLAEEPTDQVVVKYDDPPIAVQGRVGARLSNITDQPLDSLAVQSRFGPRPAPCAGCSTQHRGVDYVAADGTTVHAAGDGVVTWVGWQNANNHGAGAGFYVKIDHGNGEETKYFHLQDPGQGVVGPPVPGCTDLGVCVGAMVTGGQPIATSDSTGNLTGPHLHFETWQNGVPVDPTLIYDEVVTGTMAMAVDYEVQAGTEQPFLLTRGILTPDDMMTYSRTVPLTGVKPGEHRLQFVVVEPSGTLEILATVPLIVVDLNGRWLDHGDEDREVTVAQVGNAVSAVYVETFVCDHRDGLGTTSETTEDFVGTLDDLTITGTIKACAFGCQAGDTSCRPNGLVDVPLTLIVDPGGQVLDGFWRDEDGNERGISLTRLEAQSE